MKITNSIKYLLIIAITYIAISIPITVEANTKIQDTCGLTTERKDGKAEIKDNGQIYYIDEKGDICNQDIGYKFFYLIFGETATSSEVAKKLFYTFYNPEEKGNNIVELSKEVSVGYVVKGLYESIIGLFFQIALIFVMWNGVKILKRGAADELNQDKQRSFALMDGISFLLILILVTPIGSTTLINALQLSSSVAGMNMANNVLAAYLNNIGVQSTSPQISDSSILSKAEANSESLLAGNLCEMQTRQAIMSNSYTSNSVYTEKGWFEGVLFGWFGDDDRIGLEKAHLCTNYFEQPDIQDNMIYSFSNKLINYRSCDTTTDKFSPVERLPEQSGYENECFKTTYMWPNDLFTETSIKSDQGVIQYKQYKSDVKNNYGGDFNYDNLILIYKKDIETAISEFQNNTNDTDFIKREKLITALNLIALKLQNNLKGSKYLKLNAEGLDNNEIGTLLYVKHLAPLNYALGAYSTEDLTKHISNRSEKLKKVQVSHLADTGNFGRLNKLTYGSVLSFTNSSSNLQKKYRDLNFTGIGIMNEQYYYEMAKNILRSQCIANIGTLNSKNSIETYEMIKDNPRDIKGNVELNFDCLVLEQNYGDEFPELEHLVIDHNQSFTGIIKDKFKTLSTGDAEADYNARADLEEEIIKYNSIVLDIVEEDKLIMTAYYYMVNKAFALNIAEKLKEYVDQTVLVETRQLGWAGLPAMMLNVSQKQLKASSYTNDLNSTFSVEAFSKIMAKGFSYVNDNAFIDPNTSVSNKKDNVLNISIVDGDRINLLMKTVNITASGDFTSEEAQERSLTAKFTHNVIEILFGTPLDNLKAGTGLMQANGNGFNDEDISQSLKRCSITQDCFSKSGHPINGVIAFGQSSVNSATNIILISSIVSLINENIDKIPSFPNPIVTVFLGLLKILAAVADIFFTNIKLFVYFFATMGIILGYFLPIMPFMLGVVMIIKWAVGTFVSLIASLIYLVAGTNVDENNKLTFGLKGLYQIVAPSFFLPLFITVSIIFAWLMANVGIYLVNSLAYMLFTVFTSDNVVTMIIVSILTYIILMLLYWFILQKSFKLITEMPTELGKGVGLQDLGGSSFASSLVFESYMLARKGVDALKATDKTLTGRKTSNVAKLKDGVLDIDNLRKRINEKKEQSTTLKGE